MIRVLVANGKGGCGKTTIATTMARRLRLRGLATALADADRQRLALAWLAFRPAGAARIAGLDWHHGTGDAPPRTQRLVVDAPAGLRAGRLGDLLDAADSSSSRSCPRCWTRPGPALPRQARGAQARPQGPQGGPRGRQPGPPALPRAGAARDLPGRGRPPADRPADRPGALRRPRATGPRPLRPRPGPLLGRARRVAATPGRRRGVGRLKAPQPDAPTIVIGAFGLSLRPRTCRPGSPRLSPGAPTPSGSARVGGAPAGQERAAGRSPIEPSLRHNEA